MKITFHVITTITLLTTLLFFNGCNPEKELVPDYNIDLQSEHCTIPELPIYAVPDKIKKPASEITNNDLKKIAKNYKRLRDICRQYATINKAMNKSYKTIPVKIISIKDKTK